MRKRIFSVLLAVILMVPVLAAPVRADHPLYPLRKWGVGFAGIFAFIVKSFQNP